MGSRALGVTVGVVALLVVGAAPAAAETVEAYGQSLVLVKPDDAKDNDSIKAAIADARATALPLALADARARAQQLADGSGLVLGDVESVAESQDSRFADYGIPTTGTFGPGQFCGTVTRSVRSRTKSGKLVRRRVKRTRCFFPEVLLTNVEVTYKASRRST
jgi:hypothetical protein